MNLPVIRASSMKLASNCAASVAGDGVQIDSYDQTAGPSTDGHRAISLAIQGKPVPELDAGTESLVELATAWVEKWLKPTFPGSRWLAELPLMKAPFTGTLDLAGITTFADGHTQGVVVDWKNTWRDDDHTAQLLAYAWLLLQSDSDMKSVIIIVPMLRLGKADPPREFSREWVESWEREFERNTLSHPEIFRPGEWCSRCRRKMTCPALLEMNRQTVDVLASPGFEGMLTRETLPDLRVRVKLVKEAIALFEGFQRETIMEKGPLKLPNGKLLKAVERNIDVIGLRAAWPILQEAFPDDGDIEKVVTVGKTKLLELIGARAPKGMKGKSQDTFMERLDAAGAVSVKHEVAIMEIKDGA